jgi:hypothetical protein
MQYQSKLRHCEYPNNMPSYRSSDDNNSYITINEVENSNYSNNINIMPDRTSMRDLKDKKEVFGS